MLRTERSITIGITDRAAGVLTLINAVDLPQPGTALAAGSELAVIDAQKALLEIPAPVPLHVTEVNDRLAREPMLIRIDPRGEGWLVRCILEHENDWNSLLDEATYQALVESERQAIEARSQSF
ncbi:MAG: glycine cleavage system protein H [Pseudonocardia sp.]|nr:glycine cleavage system protein H [Pseudonocardia sp.]